MIRGLAGFIPGTQARADRLFKKSLARRASKGDVLLWIEYPDGDVKIKPGMWNEEINCWETAGGQRWFPRGKGGDPKRVGSVPVVQVHTSDAGIVSTDSTLMAGAVTQGLVAALAPDGTLLNRRSVKATGADAAAAEELANAELDQEPPDSGAMTNGKTATDGGAVQEPADYVPLYDGVEFALSDAVEYDPFPVREEDARQAAEWYEIAGRDDKGLLKYVGMGAVAAVLIILGVLGFIWLLGEIGSGDSTGVSLMLDFTRLLTA